MSKLYPKKAAAVTRKAVPYPSCAPPSFEMAVSYTLMEELSASGREPKTHIMIISHNAVIDIMWRFKALARSTS